MTALTTIAIMFVVIGLMFRLAPTIVIHRLGVSKTVETVLTFRTFGAGSFFCMAALLVIIQFVPE